VLKQWLGYDDSLDVFGVHGISGIVGGTLVGVFAASSINGKAGWIEGNPHQVTNQLLAVATVCALCVAASLALMKGIDLLCGLRVGESDEYDGLDITQHGESGYNFEEAFSDEVVLEGTSLAGALAQRASAQQPEPVPATAR